MSTRALLYKILRRLSPSEFTNLQVKTGPSGKPYIAGHPSWHFNISHSHSVGVCAVGRVPLGIDIETIDKRRNWPEIAERFFHKQEIAYLRQQRKNGLVFFYHFWTRKESWLKLKEMPIWQIERTPCCFDQKNSDFDIRTWKGSGLTPFSLSLCVKGGGKNVTVRFLKDLIPEGIILNRVRLYEDAAACR
ncbi:MAG: 4'-phosphopantetheinyl transferase superfamily protein [Spirochaetia bacterium]